MAISVIEAVECAKCHKLHAKASMGYLTIWGQVIRRRSYRGDVGDQAHYLGTAESPTVLCDNNACLIEFINPTDH